MRNGVKNAAMGETVRLAALVLAFGLSAAMPSRALGQQPAGKTGVGQRVVPKHRDLTLQNGGGKPARAVKPDIYRVEQVNRGWLQLRPDGGPPGWVGADQVVSLEQAVPFFSDAIGKHPRDPHNYTMRALVLMAERDDPQHALADCNEAIRLDPKDPVAHSIRGTIHAATQNYAKAIADFDEVVRLRPKDGASYHDRGTARMFQRDPDRAIADFNQAIQLDPKDPPNFVSRAAAWLAEEPARPGHRRSERGDPARSRERRRLPPPRLGQRPEGGVRPGHRRLHPDHQAGSPRGPGVRGARDRLAEQEGIRPGDRRLQRGDPSRPEQPRRLCRAQPHLAGSARVRQGHRRPRPGHPPRSREPRALRLPRRHLGRQEGLRPGHHRLQPGASGSSPRMPGPIAAAASLMPGSKQYDQAIADLDRAIQLDPKNTDALNGRAWFRATCPVAAYRDGPRPSRRPPRRAS